ncbi:adenosylcobinamide-GDP ribazoletransferase [Solihabitans fulvus]|uniref:adenosylcobinamide-GDP ribazoletransferase n=1 Tax=Solihabitans fulvus TaxID=1892852 RepID=UPI003F6728ED
MSHGLRLAVSWLTVLPVRAGRVDAASCRQAITLAPLIGLLLGGVAAGASRGLELLAAPPLLAGLLVVGLLALLTRGMHLDGLADTVDGLGCYGPPERALAVMKDGGAGPFAVVALIVVLGAEAVCFGSLPLDNRTGAVVLALTVGRAAFLWCCRRGVPPARPDGMGALVAGSQTPVVVWAWWAALLAVSVLVAPGRPWLGPVAVVAAGALVVALVRHVRRRFGGITGDVLGAAAELATLVVLVVCTLAR